LFIIWNVIKSSPPQINKENVHGVDGNDMFGLTKNKRKKKNKRKGIEGEIFF